ncbi:MAG: hypothetical protein HC850_06535 [Rhodomicrobium sp.]|nr:hypothetical protein [Rhodomicrobium sp.]
MPRVRQIDTLDVAPDPELMQVIAGYEAQIDKDLGVVIGVTETAFSTRRGEVRNGENPFGNLVCDAMIAATQADICIVNSGGIRGDRDYAAGVSLTRKTILEELPFGNVTVVVEIEGKLLREVLETGLGSDGGFPQIGGMSLTADMTRPVGNRLQSVSAGGKPLDDAASYKLATNNYLLNGGNGYVMLKQGKVLIDELGGQYVAGQVIGYIERRGKVAPKVEGRLVLTR